MLHVKKKIGILIGVCLVLFAVASACKTEDVKELSDPLLGSQTGQETSKAETNEPREYPIRVQYIRTDGYNEEIEYPRITVVRSAEELNAYYEANKNLYNLERREVTYADTTIGFLDACDRYDEDFFAQHDLILVLWEEGSGSIRHEIRSITPSDDHTWILSGIRKNPEVGTCDMAEWHFMVEIEKNNIKENDEIILDLENWNSIGYWYRYANMELALPNGWDYSVEPYEEGAYTFGISFWPAGRPEGKLKLNHYPNRFGVCGTGLSEEKYTFTDGKTAYIGTYDNSPVWDFISFRNTAGDYAVINEGADIWWDEYKEEAMSILNTIRLAQGMLSEDQAIESAKPHCTVEYDEVWGYFDCEEGTWEITFWVSDPPTASGDQTVLLDVNGTYIDSFYGE